MKWGPAVGFYLKMQLSFLLCIQSTPMMIGNNSSYTTMNESVYTLEKRIENGDYKDNRKLLDRFNLF